MCDKLKVKFQQTIHGLDVLTYNQRLLRDNINEDGWLYFFIGLKKK
jgi:hypothetical protein